MLVIAVGCGLIGFADDFIKLRHRRSLGLRGRWKLLLLAAITVGVSIAHAHVEELDTSIYIPIVDFDLPLSWAYYPLLFLVIAGTANGVNLTDGLDGLAAGTTIISLLTFLSMVVIAYIRSGPVGGRSDDEPRPRDPRRGADRRHDRLPLVQRLPRRGLHGRHRLDGARRRARRVRDHDRHRDPAAPDRRRSS